MSQQRGWPASQAKAVVITVGAVEAQRKPYISLAKVSGMALMRAAEGYSTLSEATAAAHNRHGITTATTAPMDVNTQCGNPNTAVKPRTFAAFQYF